MAKKKRETTRLDSDPYVIRVAPDAEDFPRSVRRRRLMMGKSQAELAAALGLPTGTVSRWERGEIAIRHRTVLDLALEALERNPKHFEESRA